MKMKKSKKNRFAGFISIITLSIFLLGQFSSHAIAQGEVTPTSIASSTPTVTPTATDTPTESTATSSSTPTATVTLTPTETLPSASNTPEEILNIPKISGDYVEEGNSTALSQTNKRRVNSANH